MAKKQTGTVRLEFDWKRVLFGWIVPIAATATCSVLLGTAIGTALNDARCERAREIVAAFDICAATPFKMGACILLVDDFIRYRNALWDLERPSCKVTVPSIIELDLSQFLEAL